MYSTHYPHPLPPLASVLVKSGPRAKAKGQDTTIITFANGQVTRVEHDSTLSDGAVVARAMLAGRV